MTGLEFDALILSYPVAIYLYLALRMKYMAKCLEKNPFKLAYRFMMKKPLLTDKECNNANSSGDNNADPVSDSATNKA